MRQTSLGTIFGIDCVRQVAKTMYWDVYNTDKLNFCAQSMTVLNFHVIRECFIDDLHHIASKVNIQIVSANRYTNRLLLTSIGRRQNTFLYVFFIFIS